MMAFMLMDCYSMLEVSYRYNPDVPCMSARIDVPEGFHRSLCQVGT